MFRLDMKRLGLYIHDIRRCRNLTIQDVSNGCGLSQQHISDIERGKRPNVTLATIYKLCKALDIDMGALINATEK